MADVYLAHDDVLDRDVALKVMSERYSRDEEFVERFRREAQSAAALSHPNIVSIYDRGRSEDGTYYIAMEYLPGGTLKDRIVKRGALPARTAAAVALQIACALQAAHRRDVIHRDIKPHNILITDPGDIKVTDFGIARAATSSTMTKTGSILGTAHYISPEQAMGDPAGPESDLYSLGVVLYEMLTGELPFDADTPIGIAMKHVNGPLRPPKELDPSIPEGINAICVRLLAKSPDERYASDAELIEDLERVSQGRDPKVATTEMMTRAMATGAPNRIVPTGVETTRIPPEDPRRNGQRRRSLPPVMILFLIAILALLAWAAYALNQNPQKPQKPPPPRIGVQDLVGMTVDEAQDRVGDDFRIVEKQRVEGEKPAGTIVDQDPEPGQQTRQGSEISVTVVGTQVADVPDVQGSQRDEAERTLQGAGFTVQVNKEASDKQEGIVISQDPSGGKAEVDSEVAITVSTGPPTVGVPGVVGNTPEQAAEILAKSNLELGSSSDTQPSNEVAKGSILYQDPKEGTEIEEGSSVDVTVSSGPEQVVVPEVYGLSVVEAANTLEAAGLVVNQNYTRVASEEPFDTALETDPQASTSVDQGTAVSLVASLGPATSSATSSASSSASPQASPQASPAPQPANNNAEARQKAREARQEAREARREARQDASGENQKSSGSGGGSGSGGNKGPGKKGN